VCVCVCVLNRWLLD